MEELRRVARVHRHLIARSVRRVTWVVAIGLVAAGGLTAMFQPLAPSMVVAVVETEVIRDVPGQAFVSVSIDPPRPDSDAGPADCPIPDVGIDRAVGRRFDPVIDASDPDVRIQRIVASPTRNNLLAATDFAGVYLSRDDGRNFSTVLERGGALLDLEFGCAGDLYAVRNDGDRLYVGALGARGETWHRAHLGQCGAFEAGVSELALYTGGGWLALQLSQADCYENRHQLWISADGGLAWRQLPIPDIEMVEDLRVLDIRRDRIRVRTFEGDCMYDGTMVHDIDPFSGRRLDTVSVSRARQTDIVLRGRWGYGYECKGVICRAAIGSGTDDGLAWSPVPGAGAPSNDDEDEDDLERSTMLAGPQHLFSLGRTGLWRLGLGRGRLIEREMPDGVDFQAADLAGRLIGVTAKGRAARWSKSSGLRVLGDAPPSR